MARTVWLVAVFDLMESLRSKKAVGLLVLYTAGALAATGVFLRVLHAMEKATAQTLGVAVTRGTGAMAGEVVKSDSFKRAITDLVGDAKLAETVSSMPPIALFYGWLALTFVPLLVILNSCDTVSSELSTGSARFVLFRAERFSWAVGKLSGQAALMTVGIACGATGAYLLGWWYMSGFQPASTMWWLARMSARAWCYGFAYLGLAMGTSQATRSVNLSRAFGLGGLFAVGLAGNLLGTDWVTDRLPTLAPALLTVFPQGHRLDLWRPDLLDRLPAQVMLIAIGAAWFAGGFAIFSRRDR